MKIASFLLLTMSVYVALMNLLGCLAAIQWRREGIDRGYSNVAGVSLLLSLGAWLLNQEGLGYWAFLPAMVDPGTLSIVILPFYLSLFRENGQ